MTGWLRREIDDGDAEPLADPEEVAALLPASVRSPEMNRFTPLGSDMPEDASDPDLAFLAAIAEEVAAPPPPAPVDTNPRFAAPERDDLRAFRDLASEREHDRLAGPRVTVENVDLADLLDDLATTVAALRRRKAA
jgi:hypothetical protein